MFVVGKYRFSVELHFSASPTVRLFATADRTQLIMVAQAESLHSLFTVLEELLKEYSPMLGASTERVVDKAIKYGAAFAEVSSPKWQPPRD